MFIGYCARVGNEPDGQGSTASPTGNPLARVTRLTESGVRALLSAQGVRGTAMEAAWITTHLAMYPLGLVRESTLRGVERHRLDHLPPEQRGLLAGDIEAAGTPIVLVHGLVDNRSIFAVLSRALTRRGFHRVLSLNHSPLTGDIRSAAASLGAVIDQVCEQTGYDRVHVVGHSMGGLIARYYVQRLGGDSQVHTLVTLGSPHAGTMPASLVPVKVVRQLRPGSDVVTELAEPAPDCRTRMVAVWSDLDQMIVPQRNARITHPDLRSRNVLVRGVGHMSLPVDGRVVHEICMTLAHLEHDGSAIRDYRRSTGA